MKTAVSVPNEVYEQAEALAGQTGRSRSEIYSTALREYLARHDIAVVTDAIDLVVEGIGVEADRSVTSAGRSRLRDVEW
jgi:metal-responsive CopG/Arc/MetJ family transcriptional regulator